MDRFWLNTDLDTEARVNLLLNVMTLEECVRQLDQICLDEVENEDLKAGQGSIILASSATAGNDAQEATFAEKYDALQKVAVEQSRLGIPIIYGRDVIHGHHTVYPIPLGQGASWDEGLVERGCRAAAVESSAEGVHWTFSPMLDIARDPRWGRIAEGYGESPLLTGQLGTAAVRGYQGDDLTTPDAIVACAKHFVGYGAAEGGRDYNSTEITDATLNDVYLPPFEAAVKAGYQTFMSAFNEIGGISAAANKELLTNILRERWGCDGFVVTDWNAIAEIISHGIAEDGADATRQGVEAKADMDMVDRLYVRHLEELVQQGLVEEASVRRCVANILRVKFRLGLFENPYTGQREVATQPHLDDARQAVARCATLLENDGTLPIREAKSIAVVGPLAGATRELFGT